MCFHALVWLMFFDVVIAISSKKHLADNLLQRSRQLMNFIAKLLWTGTKRSVLNTRDRVTTRRVLQVKVSWRPYSYRIGEISIYTVMLDFEESYQCNTKENFTATKRPWETKVTMHFIYRGCHVSQLVSASKERWESRGKKINLNWVNDCSHALPWVMTWNSQRNPFIRPRCAVLCSLKKVYVERTENTSDV